MADSAGVQSADNLRRRVSRFLSSRAYERSRVSALIDTLARNGPVAIFGGMIRDLSFGGSRAFWSDVDLVVSGSLPGDLGYELKRFKPRHNSFGGYRLDLGRWRADVWCLADTWAFHHGHLALTGLNALPGTAFFNWDAVAYDAASGKLFCRPDYLENIQNRILDINFEPNPKPLKMVVRTLRFMLSRQARLAPSLARYVHLHLRDVEANEIAALEKSGNQPSMLDTAIVRRIAEQLRAHVETNSPAAFELESEQLNISF